jgi:RNA polymerase sigma-70 factor (ECF subfamily)
VSVARVASVTGVKNLDHPAERGSARDDFAAAYLTHRSAIYAYVQRMISNDADAEDLTVVTFEKALRAWNNHPPEHELRPWLFRIATNTCLDELRRRQRIRWQPWETFVGLFHPSQVAPDDPEKETLRREASDQMRAALDKLGPRDRSALILREYHGLSVEEVARAIGITPATAKVVLFRARERLRAAYLSLEPANGRAGSATGEQSESEAGPRVEPRRPARRSGA